MHSSAARAQPAHTAAHSLPSVPPTMTARVALDQGAEPAAKRPRLEPPLRAAPPSVRLAPSTHGTTDGAPAAERQATIAQPIGVHSTGDAGGSLPARICHATLQHWERMAKTGKPQPHEHTCMAAFVIVSPPVQHERSAGTAGVSGLDDPALSTNGGVLTVVAVGTGMKCLSADARCAAGRLINDSHAEVIAKRALQRWIYAQLSALAAAHAASSACNTKSAYTLQTGGQVQAEGDFFVVAPSTAAAGFRARLRPGCRLHLWVSQAPCGDASIVEGDAELTAICDGKAAPEPAACNAVGRTGAKLLKVPASAGAAVSLPGAADVESEAILQRLGAVRRKPGRGIATLSLSCSDKLARWSLLGVQVCTADAGHVFSMLHAPASFLSK